MKKSFKDRLGSLGLSYYKELLIIALIAVVFVTSGLLLIFLLKEVYLGIIVFILGAAVELLYTSKYRSLELNISKERVNEFISVLSYFEVYYSKGNDVYSSFKLLLPFCSQYLQDAINSFLLQSESDKTVNPFICIANKFDNSVVTSLMMSIYQLSNGGNLLEFDLLYQSIRNKQTEVLIESKKKSLDSLYSFPLIGAGAITVLFALQILSVIGDYVNVI